jgi:hypothetical protein
MFPPRSTVRAIVACTLACGLLATTTSGPAAARPIDDGPTSSLAGTTTPRQELRSSNARDAEQIAHAMEDYYQSFDEPAAVASPQPTSPPPAPDTPGQLISAVAAVVVGALAASAFALRRRHRTRVAS